MCVCLLGASDLPVVVYEGDNKIVYILHCTYTGRINNLMKGRGQRTYVAGSSRGRINTLMKGCGRVNNIMKGPL